MRNLIRNSERAVERLVAKNVPVAHLSRSISEAKDALKAHGYLREKTYVIRVGNPDGTPSSLSGQPVDVYEVVAASKWHAEQMAEDFVWGSEFNIGREILSITEQP